MKGAYEFSLDCLMFGGLAFVIWYLTCQGQVESPFKGGIATGMVVMFPLLGLVAKRRREVEGKLF